MLAHEHQQPQHNSQTPYSELEINGWDFKLHTEPETITSFTPQSILQNRLSKPFTGLGLGQNNIALWVMVISATTAWSYLRSSKICARLDLVFFHDLVCSLV
ncbi:hypothetical protein ACMFMG_002733 [Clarireedia jacksonii]